MSDNFDMERDNKPTGLFTSSTESSYKSHTAILHGEEADYAEQVGGRGGSGNPDDKKGKLITDARGTEIDVATSQNRQENNPSREQQLRQDSQAYLHARQRLSDPHLSDEERRQLESIKATALANPRLNLAVTESELQARSIVENVDGYTSQGSIKPEIVKEAVDKLFDHARQYPEEDPLKDIKISSLLDVATELRDRANPEGDSKPESLAASRSPDPFDTDEFTPELTNVLEGSDDLDDIEAQLNNVPADINPFEGIDDPTPARPESSMSKLYEKAIDSGFVTEEELANLPRFIQKLASQVSLPGGSERSKWEKVQHALHDKLFEVDADSASVYAKYLERAISIVENMPERQAQNATTYSREGLSPYENMQLDLLQAQKIAQESVATSAEKEVIQGREGFLYAVSEQKKPEKSPMSQSWVTDLEPRERKFVATNHLMLEILDQKITADVEDYAKKLKTSQFNKEKISGLFEEDAFRIAFATIMKELYKMDHLVEGDRLSPKVIRLSDKGKELFDDDSGDKLSDFKADVVQQLSDHLQETGRMGNQLQGTAQNKVYGLDDSKKVAELAFSSAWNFTAVGLVPESADTQRKSRAPSPKMISKFRRFMHPKKEAQAKFFKDVDETESEEIVFGELGKYLTERKNADSGFRREFDNSRQGRRYLLDANLASMFDHIRYIDEARGINKTMAEIMLDTPTTQISRGAHSTLADYQSKPDMSKIEKTDPGFVYSEIVGDANNVFSTITADRDTSTKLEVALASLNDLKMAGLSPKRNDKVLEYLYTDEDTLEDLIVAAIAGDKGGFVRGTSDEILSIPEYQYLEKMREVIINNKTYITKLIPTRGTKDHKRHQALTLNGAQNRIVTRLGIHTAIKDGAYPRTYGLFSNPEKRRKKIIQDLGTQELSD